MTAARAPSPLSVALLPPWYAVDYEFMRDRLGDGCGATCQSACSNSTCIGG